VTSDLSEDTRRLVTAEQWINAQRPTRGSAIYRAVQLGDPCQHCGERPSTGMWTGDSGTLAYVHGCYAFWCAQCMLRAQIEHAEGCAARLPELRSALEKLT